MPTIEELAEVVAASQAEEVRLRDCLKAPLALAKGKKDEAGLLVQLDREAGRDTTGALQREDEATAAYDRVYAPMAAAVEATRIAWVALEHARRALDDTIKTR